MNFLTTVTGSYPRKDVQKDTLRKSSVSDEEALDMIKWAVKEQADLGLDIITDGEGYSCLLYTSPSPRDVEESRMPSSA